MVRFYPKFCFVASAGVYLSPFAFSAAIAQGQAQLTAQENSLAGEEILVTAQKRVQSARDIGQTINVLGGADLRRLQANDVATVSSQVPNIVATTSANLPAFTVRGIGLNEIASNFDAPVAVHVDEVYRSKPYMNSAPFFDIQRVEVLKGPQGTLFGRNSPGGAVNFYTVEPQLQDEGAINLNGDNHGRFKVDGVANLMLASDLAARFSYFVAQGIGGPYHNLATGKDYGAPNQVAGRLQVKWFGETTTVKLSGHVMRDKSETSPYKAPGLYADTLGSNGQPVYCPQILNGTIDDDRSVCLKFPPGNPGAPTDNLREVDNVRKFTSNKLWLANNSAAGGSLRIEQSLGQANLVSVTAYENFERGQGQEGDDTVLPTADTDFHSHTRQFTQEVRIAGKTGKLNYLVGGFYERDKISESNSALFFQSPVVVLPTSSPRLGADFVQKVRSVALFTHNEFEIIPSLSVVAGVRYTNDRISVIGNTYFGANDPVGRSNRITPVTPVDSVNARRTDENISFRGGLNWRFLPDQLAYVSIARGFRSGGYNVPFGGRVNSFSPERLTAYEVGYKGRLIDKMLDLNISAFRYDYKDMQINVNAQGVARVSTVTANAGSSRSYGAETDLTFRPDESWVIRAGASYLDSKFRNTTSTITTYAGVIPLDGKRPVNTPKWTAQAFVQKTFPLSSDLDLIVQSDGKYIAKRYLRPANQIFDRAPSYWLQNARIAVASSAGKWEVAAWGRNIFNKEYLTYLNNVSFVRLEIYGDPASYGLSASYKF